MDDDHKLTPEEARILLRLAIEHAPAVSLATNLDALQRAHQEYHQMLDKLRAMVSSNQPTSN